MSPTIDEKRLEAELATVRSGWKVRAFTLAKMPLGALAGLTVQEATPERSVAYVPGGWRSQNPFGSMFWAAQGMGAELASGVLALAYTQAATVPVRMIVSTCEATFERQAKTGVRFVFEQGDAIRQAVASTLATGESVDCPIETIGYDAGGEVVSRWTFAWNFRARLK